jgi:hypothetical protein
MIYPASMEEAKWQMFAGFPGLTILGDCVSAVLWHFGTYENTYHHQLFLMLNARFVRFGTTQLLLPPHWSPLPTSTVQV